MSIRVFYGDHGLPHFHAVYGEHEVKVDIRTGAVLGRLPQRALRLVMQWYPPHEHHLLYRRTLLGRRSA